MTSDNHAFQARDAESRPERDNPLRDEVAQDSTSVHGRKDSAQARPQERARAFVDGIVDKVVVESITGVLTIPGLNTVYKSVFDKDIPLPEKSHRKREGAEQFFYEGGAALAGLAIDALMLKAAKPLQWMIHNRQNEVGMMLRHSSWRAAEMAPNLPGLESRLSSISSAVLRTSGQTPMQINLLRAGIAGGLKGALFEVGEDPQHAGWDSRLKHAMYSSSEFMLDRFFADKMAAKMTNDGMVRYYGALPVRNPYLVASSAAASAGLALAVAGTMPLLQGKQDLLPGVFGNVLGSGARGALLGFREDMAFEFAMHNLKALLTFKGKGSMVSMGMLRTL